MIWAIIALVICVIFFGWWGILWFALFVGFFAIVIFSITSKTPPIASSKVSDFPIIQSTVAGEIKCPKCGSTQITANKKGYSVGQAVAGGLLVGAIGSNKIKITCLKCGNVFNPGEGK